MVDQQGDVGTALAEWRDCEWKRVETVKQILPESPFLDPFLEISVCRLRYPHFTLMGCAAPTLSTNPFFKNPEELHLEFGEKFADFVQENSFIIGDLELSLAGGRSRRTRENAPAFRARRVRSRRRDGASAAQSTFREEGPVLPGAGPMNCPREDSFPSTCFTQKQNSGVGSRNTLHSVQDVLKRVALPYYFPCSV